MPRQQNIKPDFYDKPFPTRLRAVMDQKDIKPEEIAKGIGSTRQSVNYYKNGDRVPDAETLCKMATFLGVSSDYLLGLTNTASMNEDIQAAAKTTGLSGLSIEALRAMSEYERNSNRVGNIEMLNAILEDVISKCKSDEPNAKDYAMYGCLLNNMWQYSNAYANDIRINDLRIAEITINGERLDYQDVESLYLKAKGDEIINALDALSGRLRYGFDKDA